MISLKKILYEVLNNYSVEVDLFVDKSAAVYDITNEIRALQGVTIVTIITPDDYVQKTGESDEYIRLRIIFETSREANNMIQQFLDNALAKDDKDAVKAAMKARGKFKKLDLALKSLKDITNEMQKLAKEYVKAKGEDKEKIKNILRDKTKTKNELKDLVKKLEKNVV